MNAGRTLLEAARRLSGRGVEEPGLNAQWLLADAMGVERLVLLAEPSTPVPPAAARRLEKNLILKERGLPLAYILGWQNFRGLRIKVDSRVLVPRPETEELAGLAADFLEKIPGPASVLDYGTGSGAIGLWLASKFPDLSVTAAEKSPRALVCARENARRLGLCSRINFVRTDSLGGTRKRFDLIVSNPPYIPRGVIPGLSPEVLSEPRVALDGGRDGLDIARMLVSGAPGRLKKGGALLLELGGGQVRKMLDLMPAALWKAAKVFKDLNGVERFLFGRVE